MSTFTLSDRLQPLPASGYVKTTIPTIVLYADKHGASLRLNRAAVRALGLDYTKTYRVSVLASTRQIGVQPDDNSTRTMGKKSEIRAHPLRDALHIKAGESFTMTAEVVDGMLTATLPDTLQTRINYYTRKNGRAA